MTDLTLDMSTPATLARIERTARAISRAKGFDPDEAVEGVDFLSPVPHASGPYVGKRWETYAHDAAAFIAALDAAS